MKCEIEEFIGYLHNTRGTSKNTEVSYERDLKKLERFLTEEKIESVEQVNATLLNSYVMYMERKNFAASSISRSIASIRAFFHFLCQTRSCSVSGISNRYSLCMRRPYSKENTLFLPLRTRMCPQQLINFIMCSLTEQVAVQLCNLHVVSHKRFPFSYLFSKY